MGYNILRYRDVDHILRDKKRVNIAHGRQVYIHGNTVYKFIDEGITEVFWNVIKSGFYQRAAPTLNGIIYDGEDAVGYFMDKCVTLHMNPREYGIMFGILNELYLETGFVFADCNLKNFGQTHKGITILDLESVVEPTKTKSIDYNNFLEAWGEAL